MPNTFGHCFRITTFGESHGGGVGVVIDGMPAGVDIDLKRVQAFLDRRRPGQSHLSSPRSELDQVSCLSGCEGQTTLGTPICLVVKNKDAKSDHYADLQQVYRPSHADFTYAQKYGATAKSGGGRASARETIGRVAAAAVAEQYLERVLPEFRAVAFVDSVKDGKADISSPETISRLKVEENPLRCPARNWKDLEKIIISAKKKGDTVGGTIMAYLHGVPTGLGDPVFDKLEADLAKAMMSLPASKGFEIGSGFAATAMFGSEHNDPFRVVDGKVQPQTNRSGGVQGGISNGAPIYFRVAFKPVSTIFKEQDTVTRAGQETRMKPKAGRHDPCVLPRAAPMVEAMAILVIMDHYLRQFIARPKVAD